MSGRKIMLKLKKEFDEFLARGELPPGNLTVALYSDTLEFGTDIEWASLVLCVGTWNPSDAKSLAKARPVNVVLQKEDLLKARATCALMSANLGHSEVA